MKKASLNYAGPGLDRGPGLNTRGAVVLTCAIACLAAVLFTSGGNTMAFVAVALTDGAMVVGWVLAAGSLGGLILWAAGLRKIDALAVSTAVGLGIGVFSIAGLLLGLAGLLNRGVAVGFVVLPIVAGLALLGSKTSGKKVDTGKIRIWLAGPAGLDWVWVIAAISLTVTAVAAAVMPGFLWRPFDPIAYDVISYHLEVPREWYELHRIVPLSHNVFSYFPFNIEINDLLLMHLSGGPWAGMYGAQMLSLALTVFTVIAIYGAGKKFGGPVGATVACTAPWVVMLGSMAYIESAVMLYTALAVTWAMRAMDGPGAIRAAILGGVSAGLACGCKITCVPMLLAAVPVGMIAASLGTGTVRRCVVNVLAFGLAGSVMLSPWLIRNIAWAHNPIYPVAMSTLGSNGMAPPQVERFRVAHSPTPSQQSIPQRIGVFWREVIAHWQFGYILLPAGLLAMIVGWRDRRQWLIAGTTVVFLIVWFGFTHLLSRFAVMLIPLAGIAIGQFDFRRRLLWVLPLIAIAAVLGWNQIWQVLKPATNPDGGGDALFGRELQRILTVKQIDDAVAAGKQIGLVGDAQAFLYQVPVKQLHYRSVFDVTPGVTDPIEAWLGPGVRGNPNWFLIINPSEIQRLHATYRNMPPLPPEWNRPGLQPFYLNADKPGRIIEPELDK